MSWDKNTYNLSEVNGIIRTLKGLNVSYKLTVLGKIRGRGLNDDDNQYYSIRKLEYKNIIILEQMIRTTDCDTDDTIISYRFNKKEELKKWKIEKIIVNS